MGLRLNLINTLINKTFGMTNLFLTRQELEELTGYKRQSAQKCWLLRKKLTYISGADGMPRMLRQSLMIRFKLKQEHTTPLLKLRF